MPSDQLELEHYLLAGSLPAKRRKTERSPAQPAAEADDAPVDASVSALPDSFGAWYQARQRRVAPRLSFDLPKSAVSVIDVDPTGTAIERLAPTE